MNDPSFADMCGGPEHLCVEGEWSGLRTGPLFRAASEGDPDTLRELFQKNEFKNEANCLDGDKYGLLHHIASQTENETTREEANVLINVIVEAGGDINLRNGWKETPLLLATCSRYVDVARALVTAGAAIHVTDWRGNTALSRAKDKGPKEMIELLEEAAAIEAREMGAQERGEELRETGNQYYMKGNYEKALEIYTKSLEVFEDYRTYGNRSACYLKIANYKYFKMGESGYGRIFTCAISDAGKSTSMNLTYAKGYFRQAKANIGSRDLPRAKMCLEEGMNACPDEPVLRNLWQKLEDLGVGDSIANPLSDQNRLVCHKLNSGWKGEARCPFCTQFALTLPLPERCPLCACDPSIEVDQDAVDELIKF